MPPDDRIGVLFICMGNICRSPLAEGVFLHKVNGRGAGALFHVDSAGCGGWHTGEWPDRRAIEAARRHGIVLPSRARQVTSNDLLAFHHLLCMDEENREHVLALGAPAERVRLLLEYHPEAPMREVPDPYYGGAADFDLCYRLIDAACDGLIEALMPSSLRAGPPRA
jgi:protein-tyrosine phosphatase